MIGKNGKKMSNNEKLEKNTIIFLDDSTNFSEINSLIKSNSLQIITFDYQSHQNLENLNMNHIVSETFLNTHEQEEIQNSCYILSKWFNEKKIKEYVEHDGINLGSLSYIEFFVFLIPFLKKFVEIRNITTKNPDSKFLASGILFNILKQFTSNVKSIDTNSSENFIYDNINFETNLFKINISKNNFLKIKKIFEKFLSLFLSTKPSLSKNSIFLVEFNTILYEKLFFKISDQNQNPIFIGTRRPAIWNQKSYSIIKNSNTHIATYSEISSELQQNIENELTHFKQKWDSFLSKNDFLNDYFSFDGISFWDSLKPYFVKLYSSRINESIKIIELTKNHFNKLNPKAVLILSESGTTEQIVISIAKRNHIPIILLQHGVGAFDSKMSDVINEFTGSMPINSNKFIVWGNAMKNYSIQFGIPEKKIEVLGSIAHEKLFEQSSNQNNSSDYILLNPEYPGQTNVKDYDVKVNQEYEDALRHVCKIAVKLDKKLIIKIKPHIPERNATKIANEVDPSIKVMKSGDMTELVKNCSIFVTFGMTSAMLDAAYFKKPVIRVRMREWWGAPDTIRPHSALSIKLNDFENTVTKLLSDSDYSNNEIKDRKKFLDDCLSNGDSVHEKIGKFLKSID